MTPEYQLRWLHDRGYSVHLRRAGFVTYCCIVDGASHSGFSAAEAINAAYVHEVLVRASRIGEAA